MAAAHQDGASRLRQRDADQGEPETKRPRGTGVFADDDDDEDDAVFGSIADNVSGYERPASANPASSFSFAGDAAASGTHATPQLPGSNVPGQQHDPPPPDEAQGPIVTCHCGLACNRLEAKTEKNMGRVFFKCPKDRDGGQCNFFEWEDQPGSGMQKAISPQQLRGPPLGGAYQPRAEEGAPQGSCFKCGQDGHWARDCPVQGLSGQGRGGGYQGSGGGYQGSGGGYRGQGPPGGAPGMTSPAKTGGPGGSGACFKCGQEGHWSRDCPQSGGGYGGGAPKGGGQYGGASTAGRSSDVCYKCSQSGHWAKDCPNPGGGGGGAGYGGGSYGSGGGSYGAGGSYGGGGGGYGGGGSGGYGGASQGYGGGGGKYVGGGGRGEGASGSCYKCGQSGHWSRDCPSGGGDRGRGH